jgi:DNA polymerase I-like protein with 3'-5' exonuclease and polymerase domains
MKKYIVVFIESSWHSMNVDDVSEYHQDLIININNLYITFQTSDLLRYFRHKNVKKLPIIIDLECFDKQMSQEGREFRDYSQWKAISALRHHKIIDSGFKLTTENLKSFLQHLSLLYGMLYEKDLAEQHRFINIELPINKLIYNRQYKGIKVDLEYARKQSEIIEKKIYDIKNKLQLEHNIFTPDNDIQQLSYLKSKDYNLIKSSKEMFKMRRFEDSICCLFYDLYRYEQDLDSLIYILSHWGGDERTYPTYLGFGSITSRIMLRQPALQNLRKAHRGVVVPDYGKKLLYIDYSQFEAGILASLSEDEELIKLYNKSDIYNDLSEKLLGANDKRKEAKIIFYRYMYGDVTLEKRILNYFIKFKTLNEFAKRNKSEIISTGKVGTALGNYRFALNENHSWSLSHVIQATASLIFKNALIRVEKEVIKSEFLLPMHDAALYQIDSTSYEETKLSIETIFIEEFKKICPQIEARVGSEEFNQNNYIEKRSENVAF